MLFRWFKKEVKPYQEGYLPNKNGHEIYFHVYGNPKGQPVLSFHGGPGSCSKAKHVGAFDLKKYRVILHDQRGCGKSLYKDRYYKNTTKELLEDAKRLLEHLKIKGKVVVNGGSWGSTVALLFAQKYPKSVKKLIVFLIFLARKEDTQWMSQDSVLFYPDFMEKIKADAGGKNLGKYYKKLLQGSAKDVEHAMCLYGGYERALGSVSPLFYKPPFDEENIAYAKLFFHYDAEKYFITENQIIKNASQIAHIPTLIVHNRLDMSCPVKSAWDLHKVLPKSKLIIVPSRGHGSPLLFKILKEEIEQI